MDAIAMGERLPVPGVILNPRQPRAAAFAGDVDNTGPRPRSIVVAARRVPESCARPRGGYLQCEASTV